MNALWSYFWPIFATGLLAGAIAGSIGFRAPRVGVSQPRSVVDAVRASWRIRRKRALGIGLGAAVVLTLLWHGPLGAASDFSRRVEASARQTLDDYEMTQVQARLQHGPLTRQLVLSGPADDFQRSELVRIMGEIPGASNAAWAPGPRLALVAEGLLVSVLSFLAGLLVAWPVELRRRYNAQWSW